MTATYPEIPLTDHALYGFYDLLSGAWFADPFDNNARDVIGTQAVTRLKDEVFTPGAMARARPR